LIFNTALLADTVDTEITHVFLDSLCFKPGYNSHAWRTVFIQHESRTASEIPDYFNIIEHLQYFSMHIALAAKASEISIS